MIAGNIGSSSIMSYTVIGDNVNLGSRLESLNKEYKTRIIISDATRARLTGAYDTRPLGDVVVKGKTRAVAIFEIVVPAPTRHAARNSRYEDSSIRPGRAVCSAAPGVTRSSAASINKAADKANDAKSKYDDLNITDTEERQLGEQVSAKPDEQVRRLPGQGRHEVRHAASAACWRRRARGPTLKWQFIVLDTDGVNAFAAPGGIVHITRGLLGLVKNEAELAGVLGHEITHVTAKHTVRAIQKSKGISMGADQVGSGSLPEHGRREDGGKGLPTWSSTASSAAKTRTKPTRSACSSPTRSATRRRAWSTS